MNTISGYLTERNIFTQVISKDDDVLHDHSFIEVFYITDGSAHHLCNGETTELMRGSIGFLRPSDQHMYIRDDGATCTHRDILIKVERFKDVCDMLDPALFSIFMESKNPFIFQLMPETLNKLEKDFSSFSAHPQAAIGGRILSKEPLLISETVNILVDYLIREKKDTPPWLNTLIGKLTNPKHFDLSLGEILDDSKICYDRTFLSRMFKKYTGCSMISYFMTSKINYSISLLIFTDMPITDIASQSGFSNVTYFNKQFKRFFGISPTQYRKNFEQGIIEKETSLQPPSED